MTVLDTHAWIWWLSAPEMLSKKAGKAIREAIDAKGLLLSSISTWEIAMLHEKGRLRLSVDVRDWIRKTESLPFVRFVPVDNTVALRAVDLPGQFHQDPADRIIVATAMTMGAGVVTKDQKIRNYEYVKTIW